jgi:hypothetical protein
MELVAQSEEQNLFTGGVHTTLRAVDIQSVIAHLNLLWKGWMCCALRIRRISTDGRDYAARSTYDGLDVSSF